MNGGDFERLKTIEQDLFWLIGGQLRRKSLLFHIHIARTAYIKFKIIKIFKVCFPTLMDLVGRLRA